MPNIVLEAGQRRLERGIPSRESIEPSDPIERVRALPSEPLQVLNGTCLRTTSRPPTERGKDVRSNHLLIAHRSIHDSRPGQG